MTTTTGGAGDQPRWLRKGWFLRAAFDDAYSDPDGRDAAYTEALALLDDETKPLFSMTTDWSNAQREQFDDVDREHFRDHWLNQPWFNPDGSTEKYMRRAFRDAIAHAQERGVALEAIWVTTGDVGSVDVAYVDNPNSVLLVLKTPTVPPGLIAAKMTMKPLNDMQTVHVAHLAEDYGPL
jgi:hypothetical protein